MVIKCINLASESQINTNVIKSDFIIFLYSIQLIVLIIINNINSVVSEEF